MMPLESSVSDATIWSITLESLIMILEVSFDYHKFLLQATGANSRIGTLNLRIMN